MINAKDELVKHIKDRTVDYISIVQCIEFNRHVVFRGELKKVLPELNFTYDPFSVDQNLHGFIWYDDGSWSERHKYHGSEMWIHKHAPSKEVNVLALIP